MSLLDKIRGEFVDIVEWLDSSPDTMVYRFERYNNEIKMGARLVVRPGQAAVFVNEGNVADEFGPGTYTLETHNMPILSTLFGWKHGFNSPFKAEVYFFNTRVFTDQKWGTPNPIIIRDPELGAVRVRAFGRYTMRIAEPSTLLTQLIGTDGLFQTEEVADQLRSFLIPRFAAWLGNANIPLFDLAAHYTELGDALRDALQPDFDQYGLSVDQVVIENISLPPEVEATLDMRNSVGLIGDLNQFTRYQAANALGASANNPMGGNAAMDLAVGLALGQQVAQQMRQATDAGAPAAAAPPPLPTEAQWFVGKDGQQTGPFAPSAMQQQVAAGEVSRDTLVWKAGMASWQAAGDTAELSALFAAVPPPLPPGA